MPTLTPTFWVCTAIVAAAVIVFRSKIGKALHEFAQEYNNAYAVDDDKEK